MDGVGADCGPVNPLQSLLKATERDASIQHDSFHSTLPGQLRAGSSSMRTGGSNGHALDEEMRAFHAGSGAKDPFQMEQIQRELLHFQQQRSNGAAPAPANMDAAWSSQFGRGTPDPAMLERAFANGTHPQQADAWRSSFLSSPSGQHQTVPPQAGPSTAPATQYAMFNGNGASLYGGGMASYGMMPGMPMMGSQYGPSPVFQQQQRPQEYSSATDVKGKGRFVELDDKAWEAQFERLEAAEKAEKSQKEKATATQPPSFEDLVTEDEARDADAETDEQFVSNLERTWKNLRDTLDTGNLNDKELAAWEAQFGQGIADLHDGMDESSYGSYYNNGGEGEGVGYTAADIEDLLSNPRPYPYSTSREDNPYMSNFDPFSEGQRLLTSGAPLAEAALAFEAACMQNEHRGEAWRALGDTLAADEKELRAIRALERAVACKDNEGGEGAWMSLAVSYVNEGMDLKAYATLENWITNTYGPVVEAARSEQSQKAANGSIADNPWSISERMTDLFLAAARAGPASRIGHNPSDTTAFDADVQSGLGVLFYTNADYARARDCFEAALSVRPTDFLLWNRLGATLANGGQPEEAISSYREALQLRPTFTRARYNLGVSCLNTNCYHEAAEHLLGALDLHRKDQQVGRSLNASKGTDAPGADMDDGSDNLWHTLRRAFLCLERPDLADKARPGSDVDEFRRDGFDF